MHSIKYRLLGAAIVAIAVGSLGAQSSDGLVAIKEWRWAPGDDPSWAAPGFDDSSWTKVLLPAQIRPGTPRSLFWLRCSFTLPEGGPSRAWLILDKGGVASELYVDGVYAGSKGKLPPRFDLRTTHYGAILLPPDLAKPGSTVTLALRCSYNGSIAPLVPYSVGGDAAAEYYLSVGNFWNSRMYSILAALCLFLGVYFVLQFAFKRSERENLYFAITLIALSLYLVDLGADYWPFASPISRALSRSGLVVSMMFLLPFFMALLGNKRAKMALMASVGVSIAFVALFLAVSGDETAVGQVFSLSCLAIFVPIVISAVVSAKALRSGVSEALPILIAVAAGIILAGHDAFYQFLGRSPFAWLQGLGFFALDLSIFVALSMRQAKLKVELEDYAREVEANKAELASSLARLGEAGDAAAKLSVRLGEAADAAAKAADEAARKSGRIGEESSRQADEAAKADRLASDFVASIGRVNESLASQTESVERTAAAATELSGGAESVALSIAQTASFTSGLAALTGSGEKAASALFATMGRVSDASKGIGEVVDAVNDFAERTNLLAMNAAIEAAHSGQAGRGFAIIAGEVKKLAASQAERASRIKGIVAGIQASVDAGSRDAESVRSSLREIASGSAQAAERLELVRRATEEQKRASEEISSSMEALAAASASIREEAGRQAQYSERVRGAVASIAEAATQARESALAIAQESAGLATAVNGLRELTARGGELTAALSGWKGKGA